MPRVVGAVDGVRAEIGVLVVVERRLEGEGVPERLREEPHVGLGIEREAIVVLLGVGRDARHLRVTEGEGRGGNTAGAARVAGFVDEEDVGPAPLYALARTRT